MKLSILTLFLLTLTVVNAQPLSSEEPRALLRPRNTAILQKNKKTVRRIDSRTTERPEEPNYNQENLLPLNDRKSNVCSLGTSFSAWFLTVLFPQNRQNRHYRKMPLRVHTQLSIENCTTCRH
jgi:hypothetical protein